MGGRGASGGGGRLSSMQVPNMTGAAWEVNTAKSIVQESIDKITQSYAVASKNYGANDTETQAWKFVADSYSSLLKSGKLNDAGYVVKNSGKIGSSAMGALATSYKAKLEGKDPGAARERREGRR